MKALVVYFSKFGNTQQVADAIGERLSVAGSVRVMSLDELDVADLEGLDLVVMGSPTHRMNLPQAVRPVLQGLPRRILPKTPAAAFDTAYKMSPLLARFTAARKLARTLHRLGGRRIVPPETFHVVDKEGPLYEGEIERAKAWAATILERLPGQEGR